PASSPARNTGSACPSGPGSAASCGPWSRTCCSTGRGWAGGSTRSSSGGSSTTTSRAAATAATSSGRCSRSSSGCASTPSREGVPMKIQRGEVREIALPLRYPFETSFGRTTRKEFLLVTVTADGVSGYGECVADSDPYYLPETNGTVAHVLDQFLIPLLLQLEIAHPRDVWPGLARARRHELAQARTAVARGGRGCRR